MRNMLVNAFPGVGGEARSLDKRSAVRDSVTQRARHSNTEGSATCSSPGAPSPMQYNSMKTVIPAKAGIQERPLRGKAPWIPAFAGMTKSWGCAHRG